MYSNDEFLEKMDKALKTVVNTTQLGASVLQPAAFNQYVLEATQNRPILSEARQIIMTSNVQNIDRVGFGSRILQYVGEDVEVTSSDAPTFTQNVLTAKEFNARTGINDYAMRRMLNGPSFETQLVSMFAEQGGIDWEENCVYADSGTGALPTSLKQQIGWVPEAIDTGQDLYGGSGGDFSIEEDGYSGMFDAMISLYPKPYFQNPSQLRLYCGWEEFDGWKTEFAGRETAGGDQYLTQAGAPAYKGIPVVYAPVMDSAEGVSHIGRACMLVNPNNLCYGVFQDITVERDRVPSYRRTDFYLTMEIDADFENEDAVVVAFPDEDHP
jgi:hypothetical protein